MPMSRFAFAVLLLAGGSCPALADGFDEGQARDRIAAAGYTDVAALHEGNLGEWMAEAEKGGQHVLLVLYRDGKVAQRQQVDVPPLDMPPLPSPAKP